MRPPAPVPVIFVRSTLFSRAILRTRGERGPEYSTEAVTGGAAGAAATGAGAAGTGAAATGAAATGAAATGAGATGAGATATGAAATGAAPSAEIRATMEFTATVFPSVTRISARMPEMGAGISVSTLSVEISKRGSSRTTASPCFFSQRVRVPSTMLSPIWGITTSVIYCSP